jgi:hypothetical protein
VRQRLPVRHHIRLERRLGACDVALLEPELHQDDVPPLGDPGRLVERNRPIDPRPAEAIAETFGRSGTAGFTRLEFMFEPQTMEAKDAMTRAPELVG